MPRKQSNSFAAYANSPKAAASLLALMAELAGVGALVAYDAASTPATVVSALWVRWWSFTTERVT